MLVVAGIGINIAFLLINLRPERPHLARRRHAKVLLRADPERAKWVKENVLDEFASVHDVEFEVVTARDFEEVLAILKQEREHPTGILLAAIDDEIADELRAGKAVRPIQDEIEPELLDETLADYIPEAVAASKSSDGKVWFIPKRAEVDIAAYLSPAVEDAYLHWEQDRAAIAAALSEANGVGLPSGYTFQKRPEAWTTYDLFVAAWYWAHHPASWSDGKIAPRVAWRTGSNEDAVADLLAGCYRHGLTDKAIREVDSTPVIEELQWEVLFRRHHLLAPDCESKEGIDGDEVDDLFRERRIAWAPIDQEDSLWLHGGAQRGADPGIDRPGELGFATLPAGASLALTDGKSKIGRTWSFRLFHFWALPVHSPHPKLAFEMAKFFTQRGLQQRETEAQGLLPIRQDLRQDYPILFRLEWMQRILDASYHQIDGGSGAIPPTVGLEELDQRYLSIREAALAAAPTMLPTPAAVRAVVKSVADVKGAAHGR